MNAPTPENGRSPRFPLRTLLLMIVALLAFARFYWVMHRRNNVQRAQPQQTVDTELIQSGDGRHQPGDGGSAR